MLFTLSLHFAVIKCKQDCKGYFRGLQKVQGRIKELPLNLEISYQISFCGLSMMCKKR